MVLKVDMSEVIDLSDDLISNVRHLTEQLEAVETNIKTIDQMDSFSGKTADSAKSYFQSFHAKMIGHFKSLLIDLQDSIDTHINTFQSDVDNDEAAIIESDYLDDQQDDIEKVFDRLQETSDDIDKTIKGVSDITSATQPSFSDVESDGEEAVKDMEQLEKKLADFSSATDDGLTNVTNLIHEVESALNKSKKGSASERLKNPNFLQKNVESIAVAVGAAAETRTFYSSKKVHNAHKNGKLTASNHLDGRKGKSSYRVEANRRALDELGVKPDAQAEKQLNHRLPKNGRKMNADHLKRAENNQATLRNATKKPGSSQWTKSGKRVLASHPELEYWNGGQGGVKQVGKATLKGFGRGAVSAVDFRGLAKSSSKVINKLNGASKGLGVAGVGLSYYSNFNDAREDGLNAKEAAGRATKDTAVDTAVGGAVQTGFTAAGTAIIPIPGVGTAVGALFGVATNTLLNHKWGKGDKKKSAMDVVKGWFH